jgi:hypothetical protein
MHRRLPPSGGGLEVIGRGRRPVGAPPDQDRRRCMHEGRAGAVPGRPE